MKNLIVTAIAACLLASTASHADIQSPPGGKYNRITKLSRGLGNMLYGVNEIPTQWNRSVREEGSVHAASVGLVRGAYRTLVRTGYGAFEFGTFPWATYKESFRPGFRGKSLWWDLNHGYSELAPELGFQSKFTSTRSLRW